VSEATAEPERLSRRLPQPSQKWVIVSPRALACHVEPEDNVEADT
jgi:hypothetical protein